MKSEVARVGETLRFVTFRFSVIGMECRTLAISFALFRPPEAQYYWGFPRQKRVLAPPWWTISALKNQKIGAMCSFPSFSLPKTAKLMSSRTLFDVPLDITPVAELESNL
jgi:hypothetical protein